MKVRIPNTSVNINTGECFDTVIGDCQSLCLRSNMTAEQSRKFDKCLAKWERSTRKQVEDMRRATQLTASDYTLRVG